MSAIAIITLATMMTLTFALSAMRLIPNITSSSRRIGTSTRFTVLRFALTLSYFFFSRVSASGSLMMTA